MKFQVDKNKVTIIEKEKKNAGEYEIDNVEFEFSSDFDELVKRATFSDGVHNYTVDIVNNKCTIPYEILLEKGKKEIGVYAFELDGDDLVLRYSPKPVSIFIDYGSYRENFDNYKEPTPDLVAHLEEQIQALDSDVGAAAQNIARLDETKADKSEVPDVSNYYTKTEVDNKIPDVSNFATKEEASIVNQNEYSKTKAVPIGKWIDGRTIYRQVFEGTSNTVVNQDKDIVVMDSSCDEIIDLRGWLIESETSKIPLNVWGSNTIWIRTKQTKADGVWKIQQKVGNASSFFGKPVICYIDYINKNI